MSQKLETYFCSWRQRLSVLRFVFGTSLLFFAAFMITMLVMGLRLLQSWFCGSPGSSAACVVVF